MIMSVVVKEIVGPVFGESDDLVPNDGLKGRVCIVVATKGGWLIPSDDKVGGPATQCSVLIFLPPCASIWSSISLLLYRG